MLKISTIAASMLALSTSLALAQSYPVAPNPASGNAVGMPRSDYDAGPPMQYVQPQGQYQNQAQAPAMTGDSDNPNTVAITDEYGRQYNSRGDRIGQGRPIR